MRSARASAVAARLMYPLLLLLAVALPLSEGIKNIAFGCLLLAALAGKAWRGRGQTPREPLEWGLLVYGLATVVATLASPEPLASAKGLLDVFRFTALYFIVAHSGLQRAQIRGILWALWLALAAGALASLPGLLAGKYAYLEILSLGQFNHTAIYLAIAIIPLLALVLLYRQRGRTAGRLAAWLLLLLGAALVLTASRAAWCAVLLATGLIAVRDKRNLRLFGAMLLALLLTGAVMMATIDEGQWHALKNKFRTTQSLHMRLAIWKNVLRSFCDRPVIGVGPELFKRIYPDAYDPARAGSAPHGHSLYLQAAATMGTVGLAAVFFLLATAVHTWWRARGELPGESWGAALWSGAGGGILVVAGVGIFNTTLHHEHGMLFCLLLGMLAAWRRTAPGAQLVLLSSDARTGGIARVADELQRAFAAEGLAAAKMSPALPPASRLARRWFGLRTLASLTQTMPAGVIALQWRPDGRLARFARCWLGLPYLVYLHGKEAVPATGRERRQLGAVLRGAVRGVAVSRATAAAVRAAVGATENIEVLPNGTTAAAWSLPPAAGAREPVVLACGRLVPRKGFDVLLRAMGELKDMSWRLVIIGDGPQRGELAQLAGELGFAPDAVLVGAVADETLWRWYQRAGIFVMPSLASPDAFEGLGLALLEAAAAGLPLVGTDAGGIPEIIRDGENGRLVPPGDAPALTAALRGLMADAVWRARLGAAAQRTARGFDWRRNARRLAGWLGQAGGGARAGQVNIDGVEAH